MRARFDEGDGYLGQDDAAAGIDDAFGAPHVYERDNGNLAISKDVLAAFRLLTADAVWDRAERAWRKREEGDTKGRQVE
jgi:hypothetical protein